jgi:hypothetical protein
MTAADPSVNVVLAFRDEQGREWLAGALMRPLVLYVDGQPGAELEVDEMKDHAFTLHKFTVVDLPSVGGDGA